MKIKALMKRKVFRVVLILVLCGVSAFLLINALKSDVTPALENQVVTMQRGNLIIDIAASGNLALSLTEDIAFEIEGTVEEILVEEGESIEEGQVLARLDTSEWEKELKTLELDLLQAELALDKAEEQTSSSITGDVVARESTDPKEIDIKELQVELAEARLAEALDASPEIIAPLDGFITKVNVEGGDEVKKGTVAVVIADPNRFEADIMVSEMDISQVEVGGAATVQVDAMQEMSLPAMVTRISPTATIQSGVVNYKVKVEIESLEVVMEERQQAMPDISSGEIPEQLKQAIEEGNITQEQVEEMMEQMPAMVSEDFQLREGLTVTVSIIVDERSDVLLVPNGAIITQGRQTYVQVVSPDGMIEERAITTGISDWQYTEVTGGLSEGEQVVVPQGTATTSTTSQQRPQGGMMIPGMGRPN